MVVSYESIDITLEKGDIIQMELAYKADSKKRSLSLGFSSESSRIETNLRSVGDGLMKGVVQERLAPVMHQKVCFTRIAIKHYTNINPTTPVLTTPAKYLYLVPGTITGKVVDGVLDESAYGLFELQRAGSLVTSSKFIYGIPVTKIVQRTKSPERKTAPFVVSLPPSIAGNTKLITAVESLFCGLLYIPLQRDFCMRSVHVSSLNEDRNIPPPILTCSFRGMRVSQTKIF